ncbi:MAG TPA: LytTR family DNA-binding domain-containing protein [Syntrophomonadaceae bacterium]|nr:LytTR family DNA-binding domain-containing protein [Syntrophomonadaceae bacterium]
MMVKLNILVVDDDRATRLYLKKIIEEVQDVIVSIAASGTEGLQTAREVKPQAVFLDIDMPGMNGLELANQLTQEQPEILLVFATAYPDFALKAFEFYSFDYLLKPFNEERIKKTVNRIIDRNNNPKSSKNPLEANIVIENQGKRILLKPSEIIYIESRKPRIHIRTTAGEFLLRGSLQALKQELNQYGFFQSHRSYLINLQHVRAIVRSGKTYQILTDSNDKIMLSRSQEAELRKLLHA